MKRAIAVLLVILCVGLGHAQTPSSGATSKIVFKNAGFTISPLDDPPGPGSQAKLTFMLSRSGGFSPNVTVMTQEFDGTMSQFAEISKKQFEAKQWTVVTEGEIIADTYTVEYSGQTQSRSLHWYSKAIKKGNFVYLTTAAATDEQWKKLGDKLKSCVDSFELLEDEAASKPATQPVR